VNCTAIDQHDVRRGAKCKRMLLRRNLYLYVSVPSDESALCLCNVGVQYEYSSRMIIRGLVAGSFQAEFDFV
jgi:hypothetical protein